MAERFCESCGAKSSPFMPRTRVNNQMMCPMCAQNQPRTAAAALHPDIAEAHRLFGCHHTSCGRVLRRHRTAAPFAVQEQRLAEDAGWHRQGLFAPNRELIHGARAYAAMRRLPDPHATGFDHIAQTPDRIRDMGRAYDALPHRDDSALPHFDAVRREVGDQYHHLTGRMGIQVHAVDEDPYQNVHEMAHDVAHNKTLKVLSTAATGAHPFFSDEENDKFRAVHDAFGHAATGRDFDRHGEEAAFQAHARMFTPHARPALTTETRGQNASLILNGEFSPQKIALLPREHWGLGERTAGRSLEEAARDVAGHQRVRTVDGVPLCDWHHDRLREQVAEWGRIARETGLRDENLPEPHLPVGAVHDGRCAHCEQAAAQDAWRARQARPERDSAAIPRPSAPQGRSPYGNPGRWPHRPLREHVEDVVPVAPLRQSLNRLATRTASEAPGPLANEVARLLASRKPDRLRFLGHDSGDGETIFHCPFCFTENTQFITESGVKTFGETVDTVQRVLTAPAHQRTEGEWVDAPIREFGEQPIMCVTLTRNQQTKTVEATPEHRWFVKSNQRARPVNARVSRKGRPRDWRPPACGSGHLFTPESTRVRKNGTRECKICAATAVPVGGVSRSTDASVTTQDLKPGMRLSYLRHPGVGSLAPDDAGVRHGVVFGDGSARGSRADVHLWGEKDKQLLRYFPDRKYESVNTADRVLGTGVPGVRVSGNLWAWMKSIPAYAESPEYLYGWLAGYFAADGTVGAQGNVVLNSANLAHLEAVRDIALGLGISTYGITKKMRAGFVGRDLSALYGIEFVGSTLNDSFFLTETHRSRYHFRDHDYERIGWTVVSVEETGRVEKVYCAVVPETHSFALADNVWVGNCGSGQVLARFDGTVQCEFCSTSFTVQVQPEMPAFPQTIDGQPIQVPGMPGPDGQNADIPARQGGDPDADGPAGSQFGDSETPGAEQGDPDDEADGPTDEQGSSLFTRKSYRSTAGVALGERDMMRHLALRFTTDRAGVLAHIRDENGSQ